MGDARSRPERAVRGSARIRSALSRVRKTPHAARSESDEAEILARLVEQLDTPRSFLEFGFSPSQLNCASLLHTCRGLLVDGDARNVEVARGVMPRKVEAIQPHLDLYNLHVVAGRCRPGELGVLSIDVDGNDFWFLQALLPELEPAVVAVEYNASLGLRSVVVPYDPKFVRHDKHPSGLYHGASLEALTRLCRGFGYRLVAIAAGGNNAFYARGQHEDLPTLEVAEAYRECVFTNQWTGTTAAEQWETIKDLPYVTVD